MFSMTNRALRNLASFASVCTLAAACVVVALFGAPTHAFAQAYQPNPLDHAALAAAAEQEQGGSAASGADTNGVAPDGAGVAADDADDGANVGGADGASANNASGESGINMRFLADRALAARAWSLTNQGYVAGDSQTIIPGALVKGIDVSEWQGVIDWDAVKADGVSYAILRIGYGGDYHEQDDLYFERNVSECERLGIPYGVYIYSYAYSVAAAHSEANHVLRVLGSHKPTYPIYYDLEYTHDGSPAGVGSDGVVYLSNSDLAAIATAFCNDIKRAGYTPGIYANLTWFTNYLTDSAFDQWEHWVAQFNNSCSYGGSYKMWQAAETGSVNGVYGYLDIDFDYDPYRAAGYTRGDLNMNDSVNIVDVQIAYDIVCGNSAVENKFLAQGNPWWTAKTVQYFVDVNGDGAADALDARAIQIAALRESIHGKPWWS